MEEERQVGCNLSMKLGDILVGVSVVVGTLERTAIFPTKVVFRVCMDYVDL